MTYPQTRCQMLTEMSQRIVNTNTTCNFFLFYFQERFAWTSSKTTKDGCDDIQQHITVVTSFFDLGMYQKGIGGSVTSSRYYQWATTFRRMVNPVVAYTDSVPFYEWFQYVRKAKSERTKLYLIKRKDLWAFRMLPNISALFEDPLYPKYHPNTVVPEYSCAQHAKYELLLTSVNNNPFNTALFSWLDIGYFREVVNVSTEFCIQPPPNFDTGRVAMTRINSVDLNQDIETIFYHNVVWVGGGMLLGESVILSQFCDNYRKAVIRYLERGLMNTDQQIIFAMNTETELDNFKPNVELQLYYPPDNSTSWFYLGYLCYKTVLT